MIQFPPIEFWKVFKETNGAFSTAEAIALYSIVLKAEQGTFLELGSHKGKSSMCIALGMPKVSRLVLVEPEFKDNQWAQDVLMKVCKYTDNVEGMGGYSLNTIPMFPVLSFCFIDSGIHDDMVMDEVKLLEDRMMLDERIGVGGIIAFHDYLNQFTAVERAYDYLLSTGKYERIAIDWQPIFDYVKEHNLEEGNNSWHIYEDLPHPPNFVGALKRIK